MMFRAYLTVTGMHLIRNCGQWTDHSFSVLWVFLGIPGLPYIKGADTFCWSENWRPPGFKLLFSCGIIYPYWWLTVLSFAKHVGLDSDVQTQMSTAILASLRPAWPLALIWEKNVCI